MPTEGNVDPLPTRQPFRSDPPQPKVDLGLGPDLNGNVEITVQDAGESARSYSFQVPTYGQPIYRLHELPDGYTIADSPEARVFGTAGAYQGNFAFDATHGTGKHLGLLGLSHYCTTYHNGKIYMSGYPLSPLYEYDPSRPWNPGTVVDGVLIDGTQEISNPKRVATLGKKNSPALTRCMEQPPEPMVVSTSEASGGATAMPVAWLGMIRQRRKWADSGKR